MITKEQAMTADSFIQVAGIDEYNKQNQIAKHIFKPIKWRQNGKCKVWKTRPLEFKLSIRHGLYSYGYITHENAHLFEVAE